MTYNNNIPQPGDDPSNSQPQILANFATLFTNIGRNHLSLLDGSNGGRHNVVEMQEQASSPALAGATFASLYTKNDAGIQNLYFKNQTQDLKLTNTASATGNGFISFGTVMFQWGSAISPNGTTVNFPTAFAGTPWSVQVTWNDNPPTGSELGADGFSATKFEFRAKPAAGNIPFSWFAVGPA